MREYISIGVHIVIVALAVIGVAFGSFTLGGAFTLRTIQERAIKSGSAHYVCDQTTGKCEFQFKGAE